MECRELVCQVTEEARKPTGIDEATQGLETRKLLPFLDWRESRITLQKLKPLLACPAGGRMEAAITHSYYTN